MDVILHTGCKLCKNGGIENYIMNLFREIDKSKYQFVFLVEKLQDKDNFSEEILKLGGKIYYYDGENSFIKKIKKKYNLLRMIDYSIAHIHVSCGIRAIDGLIAKIAHPQSKIIFHSHSNIGKRPLKYTILIPIYKLIGNRFFACSNDAAKYFFGNRITNSTKYYLAKNAINPVKFLYNSEERINIRHLYNISEDVTLLGYVGRLSSEKNIRYLLDIILYLNKDGHKVKGIIIGDGPEKNNLVNYIKEKELGDYIIFTGNCESVGGYLSAMDALVLPSFHEGLGIVLVEAQAASLMCFASDRVPEETKISNLIHYFSILDSPSTTASMIMRTKAEFKYGRPCFNDCIDSNGYSISESAKNIEVIYNTLLGEN